MSSGRCDEVPRRSDTVVVKKPPPAVLWPAALGTIVLIASLATAADWVNWSTLVHWLQVNSGLIVSFGIAAALLIIAGLRVAGKSTFHRMPKWGWALIATVTMVALITLTTTALLLHEASQAMDPAAARVEAIKVGLGTGAGAFGIFALLLAVRRQWHQESHSRAVELDAAEKRVTELYTKAVEQLGSSQAPVRLGGLYALERVAQDNPSQRQTVVNVICAYLRMKFDPQPAEESRNGDSDGIGREREDIRLQEFEVRLTAESILNAHLRPGENKGLLHWKDINLDLSGAVLFRLNLFKCMLREVRFDGTRFMRNANFGYANFTGYAFFQHATFEEQAEFSGTHFSGYVNFDSVIFTREAGFFSAKFCAASEFKDAKFLKSCSFRRAEFSGAANFQSVEFEEEVSFRGAKFDFSTSESSKAAFVPLHTLEAAIFRKSVFRQMADFERVRFRSTPTFDETVFCGKVSFDGADFDQGVPTIAQDAVQE